MANLAHKFNDKNLSLYEVAGYSVATTPAIAARWNSGAFTQSDLDRAYVHVPTAPHSCRYITLRLATSGRASYRKMAAEINGMPMNPQADRTKPLAGSAG